MTGKDILVWDGKKSSLKADTAFDPKFVFQSGALIKSTGYFEADGDVGKEVVIHDKNREVDDPRIDRLCKFAANFRESAENASAKHDAQMLPKFVSDKDKKEFLSNPNFDVGFERLAAKYFTEAIQHKSMLGPYNEERRAELKELMNLDKKAYGNSLKNVLYDDDNARTLANDYESKRQDKALDQADLLGAPKDLANYGKHKGGIGSVCLQYAPTIATMFDSAKVPCQAFTCRVNEPELHGYYGHASVVSLKTGNIIEASSSDMDETYMEVIATSTGKNRGMSTLDALHNGGRVLTYNPERGSRTYATVKDNDTEFVMASRYSAVESEKIMRSGLSPEAKKQATASLMVAVDKEIDGRDIWNIKIDNPQMHKFAEKDAAASAKENPVRTFFEKNGGDHKSSAPNPVELPQPSGGHMHGRRQ